MEKAFSDLHRRFEKSKNIIEGFQKVSFFSSFSNKLGLFFLFFFFKHIHGFLSKRRLNIRSFYQGKYFLFSKFYWSILE